MAEAEEGFPDPREEADAYLKEKKVYTIMQELGQRLMYQRPSNPQAFMVEQLKAMQSNDSARFFATEDLGTMFRMFDLTGKGHITPAQYEQALRCVGVDTPTVPIPTENVDSRTFQTNIEMELQRMAL